MRYYARPRDLKELSAMGIHSQSSLFSPLGCSPIKGTLSFHGWTLLIIFCIMVLVLSIQGSGIAGTADEYLKPESPRDYDWSFTLITGIYTDRRVGQASLNVPGKLEKKYFHGLALSRQITRFWEDMFMLELEGLFAKHHGRHKEGYQDYEEYVLALFLRYDRFPWRDHLHMSFAVGEGLSLTSEVPIREVQIRGNSRRLLNYLAFELAATLPAHPRYSLVYRIHHRSGVFGLFGGIRGASDFYTLGIRYSF